MIADAVPLAAAPLQRRDRTTGGGAGNPSDVDGDGRGAGGSGYAHTAILLFSLCNMLSCCEKVSSIYTEVRPLPRQSAPRLEGKLRQQ